MNHDPIRDARNSLAPETDAFSNRVGASVKRMSSAIAKMKKDKSVRVVMRALSSLSEALSQLEKESAEIKRLAGEWDRVASGEFLQLEATLRDICSRREWRLDGNWPDFIVELGVPVAVSETDRSVRVGERAVDGTELEPCLDAAVKVLLPKKFSPAAFLAKIAAAYDNLSAPGRSQVPMLEVYRQVVIDSQTPRFWRDATSLQFTALTVDQFRCQFSRMMEGDPNLTVDGRELRLFPPLNPKDAIFMFQPAERRFGFVGRIEFVRQ